MRMSKPVETLRTLSLKGFLPADNQQEEVGLPNGTG
jgi:hypothetical protein